MREEFNIREWQEKYAKGEFSSPDFDTQVYAGWYDWFCNTNSLEKKTHRFAKVIMKLQNSKRIDLENSYIWFKNNCPFDFPLYDDLRIADKNNGGNIYVISYKEPYDKEKHLWNVYALREPLVIGEEGPTTKCYSFRKTKDLIEWLNEA